MRSGSGGHDTVTVLNVFSERGSIFLPGNITIICLISVDRVRIQPNATDYDLLKLRRRERQPISSSLGDRRGAEKRW